MTPEQFGRACEELVDVLDACGFPGVLAERQPEAQCCVVQLDGDDVRRVTDILRLWRRGALAGDLAAPEEIKAAYRASFAARDANPAAASTLARLLDRLRLLDERLQDEMAVLQAEEAS